MTIGGATRLVGLIGDAVEHSLSPVMQNAAFAAVALDWAYLPLHVKREALEEAVAGLAALGFAGANVTIPHKTAVVGYCDELDEVAARAGSVNTLVVRDGTVFGSSTDGPAVVGLVAASGARVLVLGAGGGAQAVATSLLDAGAAELVIGARDAERGHALCVRLRTIFPDREIRTDEWPPTYVGASLLVAVQVQGQLDGLGGAVGELRGVDAPVGERALRVERDRIQDRSHAGRVVIRRAVGARGQCEQDREESDHGGRPFASLKDMSRSS